MSLLCYRCGENLEALSLPLSRLDACPACSVDLHVCRMCLFFSPAAPDACTEEDAVEVLEKTRANFCDYFKPSPDRFDGRLQAGERQAREELARLFGDAAGTSQTEPPGSEDGSAPDPDLEQANSLFRN